MSSLDDLLKTLHSQGCATRVTMGGKHPRLHVTGPDGKEIVRIIPSTPSDHRWVLNSVADIRRELGMTVFKGEVEREQERFAARDAGAATKERRQASRQEIARANRNSFSMPVPGDQNRGWNWECSHAVSPPSETEKAMATEAVSPRPNIQRQKTPSDISFRNTMALNGTIPITRRKTLEEMLAPDPKPRECDHDL